MTTGAKADNVEFMMHSLGTLLAYEALRLQDLESPDSKIVHNVISFESAMFHEAFEPEGEETYSDTTYCVDGLKRHSWKFWFNSSSNPSPLHVKSGGIYHSHVDDDEVIMKAFRLNDWLWRGFSWMRWWHYFRGKLGDQYRAPEPSALFYDVNTFNSHIPGLMAPRQFPYAWNDLSRPLGAVPHPAGTVNFNAKDDGNWRKEKHSDFMDVANGTFKDRQWFPKIYTWYTRFLGKQINSLNPAVPIGVER